MHPASFLLNWPLSPFCLLPSATVSRKRHESLLFTHVWSSWLGAFISCPPAPSLFVMALTQCLKTNIPPECKSYLWVGIHFWAPWKTDTVNSKCSNYICWMETWMPWPFLFRLINHLPQWRSTRIFHEITSRLYKLHSWCCCRCRCYFISKEAERVMMCPRSCRTGEGRPGPQKSRPQIQQSQESSEL